MGSSSSKPADSTNLSVTDKQITIEYNGIKELIPRVSGCKTILKTLTIEGAKVEVYNDRLVIGGKKKVVYTELNKGIQDI